MENKVIEVLMALNAIRELHGEESNRLNSEMQKHMTHHMDVLGKLGAEHVELEDVMQTAEISGRMLAIVDEQKFITKELSLINDLINVLAGNQEGEA